MKTISKLIFLTLLVVSFSINKVVAQADRDSSTTFFYIITNSGGEFIGTIISQNAKEVLINTRDRGQVSIPKYEIKEMKEVNPNEMTIKGNYIPEEVFSTRYFITTNALPIKKGENYVLWSLYGPEVQFGVGENLGLGIMTSWVGMPVIGTAKYSIKLTETTSVGVGTLLGTGSWAAPDVAIALPFGALTIGNRRANINFSGGYGVVAYDNKSEGKALFSVAGMAKIGKKVSIVFDSFIVPNIFYSTYIYDNITNTSTVVTKRSPLIVFLPGIRVQGNNNSAFQFGFAGAYGNGEMVPIPIPMLQWFRKF